MSIEQTLHQRSGSQCELCTSQNSLSVYEVPPSESHSDKCLLLCESCNQQLSDPSLIEVNHWRCLNDSIWSPVAAAQVVSWRQLKQLVIQGEIWAQDLLDMMYLESEVQQWAETDLADDSLVAILDVNGVQLQTGDTVTIIKDLDVKGAGFTAKRGTAVRNISLTNNPLHIEGRVNGSRIVIIAAYTKKS